MTEINELQFFLLALTSLIGGVLSAITGGGGLLVLPALLMTGLPPQLALGTNKLFTTAGLLTSSIYYIRQKLFNPILWQAATLATLFGTMIGASLAVCLPSKQLAAILPLCLLIMCIYFLLPSTWAQTHQTHGGEKPCRVKSSIASSLLGIYSGFIGAGTGSIWTVVAMKSFNLSVLEASAVSRVMCFISNASALIIFIAIRQVDFLIGMMLVVSGIFGASIGANLCIKHGARIIRPAMIFVTAVMSAKLGYDAWLI